MAAPVPSTIGEVRSQYLGETPSQAQIAKRREHNYSSTQQTSKSKISSLLKKEGEEVNNYSHLSDFLKSHIYRGTVVNHSKMNSLENEDAYSQITKKNKFNNQLIEKASLDIKEKRSKINASAQKRAASYAANSISNQNINSAFLLGQRTQEEDNGVVNTFREYADPNTLSEKKSSIAKNSISGSYLSNRLSR